MTLRTRNTILPAFLMIFSKNIRLQKTTKILPYYKETAILTNI